jgi:protein-tyrosine phosphatase
MTKTQNAANPFFSNIRQNLELSHGSLKERFPIRLPSNTRMMENGTVSLTPGDGSSPTERYPRFGLDGSSVDTHGHFQLPAWLCDVTDTENGPKKLAEMYEVSVTAVSETRKYASC